MSLTTNGKRRACTDRGRSSGTRRVVRGTGLNERSCQGGYTAPSPADSLGRSLIPRACRRAEPATSRATALRSTPRKPGDESGSKRRSRFGGSRQIATVARRPHSVRFPRPLSSLSRRPHEPLHRVEILRGDERFVHREPFDRRTAVFESLAQESGRDLVPDDRLDRVDDGRYCLPLAASGRRGRLREQLRERRLDVRREVGPDVVAVT